MPSIYIASAALHGRGGHDAGRALLAGLYADHVGGPLPRIEIGPMGKPYFVESGWYFSISHTKGHAFCVLADVPVGLDAEEMDRPIRLSMAPKILSTGELAQFSAAEDPRLALLTFWVLKEAQAKLTGEGMKWHPTHTNFSVNDARVQRIDGCLVALMY